MTAYKYYKIDFSKSGDGLNLVNQYVCINEIEFRETVGGSSVLTGSTITTNGATYSGQNINNIIDGNVSTFTEINTSPAATITESNRLWLRFELATAKIIREIRILSTSYTNEKPQDFIISGSNDGINWTYIYAQNSYLSGSTTDKISKFNATVSGVVKTPNNSEVKVVVMKNQNNVISEVGRISTVGGVWSFYVDGDYKYYILYIGSGLRPQADGEITPTVY